MCREANRLYYHARQQKIREVIQAGIEDVKTEKRNKRIAQVWKPSHSDDHFIRYYRRRCPGVHGHRCRWKSHLRKDSPGGLCTNCRELLVRADRVGTREARTHLKFLSRNGVGTIAVQKASGVGKSTLQDIKSGKATKIDRSTERKILAVSVTDKAPKALVDAGPTVLRIRELLTEAKMSKTEIATRLYGRDCPALQLNKSKVTVKNALAVERLHRQIMRELRADPGVSTAKVSRMLNLVLEESRLSRRQLAKELGWNNLKLVSFKGYVRTAVAEDVKALYEKYVTGVPDNVQKVELCADCGFSHEHDDRIRRLRSLLPCTYLDARETYPCVYPNASAGLQQLYRDLHEVAVRVARKGHPNLWVLKTAASQGYQELPPEAATVGFP